MSASSPQHQSSDGSLASPGAVDSRLQGHRNIFALILAGGASARFWPFSGDDSPKYLLKPDGKRTLIDLAFSRCCTLTDPSRVMVVTGEAQSARVQTALPQLPTENLLVEPARRDTLAAVTLGVETAYRRDSDAIVVVTPADGLVQPDDAFAAPLAEALGQDADSPGPLKAVGSRRLFSFGVIPSRAETGFGYLQRGEKIAPSVYKALRFVEKPDQDTAMRYVDAGDYYWNTGSFVWCATDFLAVLDGLEPTVLAAIRGFLDTPVSDRGARRAAFESAKAISVDYGVMERAAEIGVLEVKADFDDIGTWDALSAHGQITGGKVIQVGSSGCEARSDGVIAFVGCDDLIAIHSGDRLLIMKKGHGQGVRMVKQEDERLADGESGG